MENLKNGAHIVVNTRHNSCLHRVKGTITGSGTLLGNPAYHVKFDSPVRYPSGSIVEKDLVFTWETELLCGHNDYQAGGEAK